MTTETINLPKIERTKKPRITPEELKKRNERLLETLRKFVEEGDAQEQKETGDFLMAALAEARESNRECR